MRALLVLTFLAAVLVIPAHAQVSVLYDFEHDTENWAATTTPTVQSAIHSALYASSGTGSLQVIARLDPAAGNPDAEVAIMHPCDLAEQMVSASVLFPAQCPGMPASGQGVRVFVKDSHWRSQFGPWTNVSEIVGVHSPWPAIAMTVSATTGTNTWMDPGFDPHDIVMVGVQVSAVANVTCDETFYVDEVSFTPNPRPVPSAHTVFTFDDLTPQIQRDKSFGPHRPYWSDDPAWGGDAWSSSSISVGQIGGGRTLTIAANFHLSTTQPQNLFYPGRKGFVRAEFFPNLDLAATNNRLLRAEIRFEPYVPPQTLVASWFLFDRRSETEWIRGRDKPVGGSEWNVLSLDLSDPQQIHTSTTWPTDNAFVSQLLFAGIQVYANGPYQGTMYLDNVTMGGEIDPDPNLPAMDFVERDGRSFILHGRPYFFAGANCYYPFYKSHYMIDDLFATLERNGIEVLRVWGFCDGLGRYVEDGDGEANGNEGCTFQPNLRTYDRLTLENFDYVVYSARRHNVRLIIPLVNYWSDIDKVDNADSPTSGLNAYGGVGQYLEWFGLTPGPSDYHSATDQAHPWIHYKIDQAFKLPFYTSDPVKAAYKDYVRMLVTRRNVYSSVTYNNEPAILAWELANEPRGIGDPTGNMLHDWIAEMSAFIKGPLCGARQLVAVGDEGFLMESGNPSDMFYDGSQGVNWERNLQIPTIDFGTARLYPDHWSRHDVAWQRQWVRRHIEIAGSVGKPLVFEEYGLTMSHADRVDRYREWMDWFFDEMRVGVAGDLLWMVAGHSNNIHEGDEACGLGQGPYYADLDGFTIWECSGEFDALRQHAHDMRNKALPTALIDSISPNPAQPPSDIVTFDGSASDGAGSITAWLWESSLDRELSVAGNFTKSSYEMTVGDHTITFTAWDEEGTTASDATTLTILNAPPTATIVLMTPNPAPPLDIVTITLAGQDNDEMGQSITSGTLYWLDAAPYARLPGTYQFRAPMLGRNYSVRYKVRDDEETWSTTATANLQVIPPAIAVDPTSLSLTCVEGRICTDTLAVWNAGLGTLAYSASASPTALLSIAPPGGYSTGASDPTTHIITFDASAFVPGDYAGTITLTDPAATNSPLIVPVTITVTTGPIIAYSPATLRRTGTTGTDATTQTLDVWNAGLETLAYALVTTPSWLVAAPPGGYSDGPASRTTHQIVYRAALLAAGDYAGSVTITDPAALNDPATVPVTLLLGSFNVTDPVSGTIWRHRDWRTVQWTMGDPTDQVIVTLYKGPTYTGYYWTPAAGSASQTVYVSPGMGTGNNYRFRLMWNEDHGIGDYSDAFSIVAPTFTITLPTGGDSWRIVTNPTLTWTSANASPSDQVLFTWYKGGNYTGYYTSLTPNDGNYTIYVPAGLLEGSDYQLRLMWDPDRNVGDYSDNFSIYHPTFNITSPNSSTSWRSASNRNVIWTTTGSDATENVLFCWYQGGSYTGYYSPPTDSLTPNDGDYTIWVPGGLLNGTDYQLRLMWGPDHRQGDYSDMFELSTPIFDLTSPGTGTTWNHSTWQTVTWTGGAPSDTVILTLYKGATYTGYYWGPTVNDGSHQVWISSNWAPGADYRMRIMWTGNGNVTDFGDYFTVAP